MVKSSNVKHVNTSNNVDYYGIVDQKISHANKVLLSTYYGKVKVT
ncbi:MAG: hypothetical protein ACI97P_001829 [Arcticibacterium sp.]|jgi:hypothetical protein